MFTRAADVSDDDIVRVVAEGWSIDADHVEYAAVGFGSHHWHVRSGTDRWFLTVDDLDARRDRESETREQVAIQLRSALTLARSLRDSGLDFVVAPAAAVGKHVVHPIDERYLAGSPSGWGPGPFTTAAAALLDRHRGALLDALARFDERVDALNHSHPSLVITHGEPHRGNTIDTRNGVMLIDWDTARLGPPERDLWALIDEDPTLADAYAERTGVEVNPTTVAMYRLHWDVSEISLFVADLRAPHDDTPDTRLAWAKLQECIDPDRW